MRWHGRNLLRKKATQCRQLGDVSANGQAPTVAHSIQRNAVRPPLVEDKLAPAIYSSRRQLQKVTVV